MDGNTAEPPRFEYNRPIPRESIKKEIYDSPTHKKGIRNGIDYDITQAVDFPCGEGTPVRPMRAGRVSHVHYMEEEKTWDSLEDPPDDFFEHPEDISGNFITIAHEDGAGGERSLYCHLSRIFVNVGDLVSEDDIIGETGNTGQSVKPHIHNEVGYWKAENVWRTRKIRWAGK